MTLQRDVASSASTGIDPPEPTSARRRATTRWIPAAATSLALLVALEVATRAGLLPADRFPPPSAVFAALLGQFGSGEFWAALASTVAGWAVALLIAGVAAVALGIVLGAAWPLRAATSAFVEFLRPVPSVALVPVAILLLGIGFESKVFLAAWAAFWPILVQTMYGVADTDRVATDTARLFGYGPVRRLLLVTLPSASPYIATGVRISSIVALALAITAELLIGDPGLGRLIGEAQYAGAADLMYALIAATGILGLALNYGLRAAERRAFRWHVAHRQTG